MSDETQAAPQPQRQPQPPRGDDHAAAAANPEQHLLEAHKLSVKVQGKEGTRGHAVWALIKEEKGKVRTLTVFEGTRREAIHHFFAFMHPNRPVAPAAPARPYAGSYRSGPRTGGRPSGGGGRPMGGRPPGGPGRAPGGPARPQGR